MLLIDEKLLRFFAVRVANTLVGAGLMFVLYNYFGASYWISSLCSYAVGGVLSFFLNKFFTFRNSEKSGRQVLLFTLNLAVCYVVAYFCAKRAVYALLFFASEKQRVNAALFAGMCLYTALNYGGQRLIVFREAKK